MCMPPFCARHKSVGEAFLVHAVVKSGEKGSEGEQKSSKTPQIGSELGQLVTVLTAMER